MMTVGIRCNPKPPFSQISLDGDHEVRVEKWRQSIDPAITQRPGLPPLDFSELLHLTDSLSHNGALWFGVASCLGDDGRIKFATTCLSAALLEDFGIDISIENLGQKMAIEALANVINERDTKPHLQNVTFPAGPALIATTVRRVMSSDSNDSERESIAVTNTQIFVPSQNCSALAILDMSCAYADIQDRAVAELRNLACSIEFTTTNPHQEEPGSCQRS